MATMPQQRVGERACRDSLVVNPPNPPCVGPYYRHRAGQRFRRTTYDVSLLPRVCPNAEGKPGAPHPHPTFRQVDEVPGFET